MLMAGLSILMERLFPISTLSQPIQLLPLIAFFHLLLHPSLLCLLWRGHQLTNVFLRSHLSLTLIFCCQHTCLSACVRMNRQYRRVTLCAQRWGGDSKCKATPLTEETRMAAFTPTVDSKLLTAEDNRFHTCLHIQTVDLISSNLGRRFGLTLIK